MSGADRARKSAASGYDPVAYNRNREAMLAQVEEQLCKSLDALESDVPLEPSEAKAEPEWAPEIAKATPATAAQPEPAGTLAPAPKSPLRRMPRRATPAATRPTAPGWTPDKQRAFVEHLAVHGCVDMAARHVGLSRQSAYQLRQRLPNSMFAMAWETAMMLARRSLMDVAIERALNGREEEVWSRGELVGTRVVHNDRMLMFVIGQKPEPVHPTLTNPELHQLWPNMLADIDAILPPVLSEADVKAKLEEERQNGND